MYFAPSKKWNTEQIPVKAILYSYFIKYEKLSELTIQAFSGSDSDDLIVYIDMYDICKAIYNRSLLGPEGILGISSNVLTSSILNLVAHMRHYFKQYHHVRTKYYIVFTDRKDSMHYCHNAHFDNIIEWNLEMLRMLCPYIPGVTLLERSFPSEVVIMNDIKQHRETGDNTPSIAISKNDNMWQIACHYDNFAVFRPRKTSTGDESFYVNASNVVSLYREQKRHMKTPLEQFIAPGMLPLYMALTSNVEAGLTAYYHANRALSILTRLVEQNRIINGYNSPDSIRDILAEIGMHKDVTEGPVASLYGRYKRVDLKSMVVDYSVMAESMYVPNIELDDIRGVEQINKDYFEKEGTPINIIYLFD